MKILTTDDEVQQYVKTLQVLEEYSFCVFLCVHMICLCFIDDRPGSDANFRLLNVF